MVLEMVILVVLLTAFLAGFVVVSRGRSHPPIIGLQPREFDTNPYRSCSYLWVSRRMR